MRPEVRGRVHAASSADARLPQSNLLPAASEAFSIWDRERSVQNQAPLPGGIRSEADAHGGVDQMAMKDIHPRLEVSCPYEN